MRYQRDKSTNTLTIAGIEHTLVSVIFAADVKRQHQILFKNASTNISEHQILLKDIFMKSYSVMASGISTITNIFCVPMYFSKLST